MGVCKDQAALTATERASCIAALKEFKRRSFTTAE